MILSEGIMSSLKLGQLRMLRATVFGEFLRLGGELRGGALGLASREFQLLSERVEFKLEICYSGEAPATNSGRTFVDASEELSSRTLRSRPCWS